MKIILYNIQYGAGLNGSIKDYCLRWWRYLYPSKKITRSIGGWLVDQDPDVVCLLEVDRGSIRHRLKNQLPLFCLNGDLNYYSSKKYGESFWGKLPIFKCQHDAFLSKNKADYESYYLKTGMKKLVQHMVYEGVSIFSVHLALSTAKKRKKQMSELSHLIADCPRPFVVMGDFNIFKGTKELEDFIANHHLTLAHNEFTFPMYRPKHTLDLVFLSPDLKMKSIKIPRVGWSDHCPVILELQR